MPMPPQANPAQATQAMLQQSKAPTPPLKTGQINVQPQQAQAQPQQDPQTGQPGQGDGGQDSFDQSILDNLEQHLNQIDPRQKQFLASSLQHYANIVIPVLGIVCGQEVMDYFLNIYKQNFAKGLGANQNPAQQGNPQQVQQPNSAPAPQGQAPNQAAPQQMPQQAPAQAPAQSQ